MSAAGQFWTSTFRPVADDLPTIWRLEPHTKAKHDLLRSYLNAFFPIVSQGQWGTKRLVFLDGFAGPGIYEDGEPGSPIIAMRAIAEATVDLTGCEFVLIFVEHRADRVASLRTEIDNFREANGGLDHIRTHVIEGTFIETAEEVLASLEASGSRLAPTFAMIDPFGFGGAPMDLIRCLLAFPKCEVFFNLMLDFVNWHVTTDTVFDHMEDLFGTTDFARVPPAGDPNRHDFLISLYGDQLRDFAGFDFVSRFRLVNLRGRPNVMFHGTRHRKGLEKIRSTMWALDPVEGDRFDARDDPNLQTLFGGEVDLDPLRTAIVEKFTGQTVTIEQLEDFVLFETGFDPSKHLKKQSLVVLEGEGWIDGVENADGRNRRKNSFPASCRVTFAADF